MKLIIVKVHRSADAPYVGHECVLAGVTPGRTYLTLDHANIDLAKLNAGSVKFEVIPENYKINGVWLCCARQNVKSPIPADWQKRLMERWAVRDVRFCDRYMRFCASSTIAFEIQKFYNSFIYITEVQVEKK
jgi:hypothetical protein